MSFYIFLVVNCSLWVLGFIFGLPLQMSTCTPMFLASQARSPDADLQTEAQYDTNGNVVSGKNTRQMNPQEQDNWRDANPEKDLAEETGNRIEATDEEVAER